METKIYKDIVGCKGMYKASTDGTIISLKRGYIKIMKQYLGTNGYMYFRCCIDGKARHMAVARAVASAFPEICGEWFDGCTVDHIDTNKMNNVASNLRVTSFKENINNPLTIEKLTKYKTDEERADAQKMYKRKAYIKNKEYYNNYRKTYYQEHKEYFKEMYKKYQSTEEYKEKNRRRALDYYYRKKKAV